jgi:hypothetical protein
MSNFTIKNNFPSATTVAIAVSGTTSAEIDLGDNDIVGIITPAEFDGTAITFTGATTSGGTFYPVAASNAAATAYTVTTTASTITPIAASIFAGVRYVKVVCGTTQTTTGTNLVLLLRKRS